MSSINSSTFSDPEKYTSSKSLNPAAPPTSGLGKLNLAWRHSVDLPFESCDLVERRREIKKITGVPRERETRTLVQKVSPLSMSLIHFGMPVPNHPAVDIINSGVQREHQFDMTSLAALVVDNEQLLTAEPQKVYDQINVSIAA
ncbi:uncharacterized protein TNCV_972871 [Trichonephila clavipes]|nr:uncharacterized protein TNCV_972871 [Trichonephila clavipes]